jgi:hypothetical protein
MTSYGGLEGYRVRGRRLAGTGLDGGRPHPAGCRARHGRAGCRLAGTRGGRPGQPGPAAGWTAETAAAARARPPVIVIAVHGVLATATILLVLLAAVGAA